MQFLKIETTLPKTALLGLSMWKEWVLLILVLRLLIKRSTQSINLNTNFLIAVFVVYTAFFIFVSDDIITGLYGFRGTVEPFAFYFIAKNLRLGNNKLKKLLTYVNAMAIIVVIFGIIQVFLLGLPFLMKYRAENGILANSHTALIGGQTVLRGSSTFTSPNHLGMYLAILTLVALGEFSERRKVQIRDMLIIGTFIIGLIISLSRSSWLAFVIGFFSLFIFRRRIKKTLIILTIVFTLISIPFLIKFNVFMRISDTVALTDPSAASKLPSMLHGISIVLQHPLGLGLGMTGPRSLYFTNTLQYHSENFYVLMAMEIGIIGLCLYLAIIHSVLIQLYKTYRRTQNLFHKGITMGTLIAVIGAYTGTMFIPSLQEISVAALLWLFIGLSLNPTLALKQQIHPTREAGGQTKNA
jgi:O-antigen ligase